MITAKVVQAQKIYSGTVDPEAMTLSTRYGMPRYLLGQGVYKGYSIVCVSIHV